MKKLILILLIGFIASFSLQLAYAPNIEAQVRLEDLGDSTVGTINEDAYEFLPKGPANPIDLVYSTIDIIFSIAAALAVIFLLIGSVRTILNFGDEEAARSGRTIGLNALLGLVIIILSYAIITNVIRWVFGEG